MLDEMMKEMKCLTCVHAPVCSIQKGGVNLQLVDSMGCDYYQPMPSEDSVVLSKEEYKSLYNDERASFYRAELLSVDNDLLIRKLADAQKQAVKEFAERLKRRIYSGFYSWQSGMTYEKFCKVEREALLIDEIAKEFGVDLCE